MYFITLGLLLGLSGWYSATLFFVGSHKPGLAGIPLPFIVLAGISVARSSRFLVVAMAMFVSWVASYAMAILASVLTLSRGSGLLYESIPLCLAGGIGGMGLVLSCAIIYSNLRSIIPVLGSGIFGSLAATPFGTYFHLLRGSGSYDKIDRSATWRLPCGR